MEDQIEEDSEELDKRRSPSDRFKDFEPGPLNVSPDGGLAMGAIGVPPAVPAATPQDFICLRGPCRHYFELQTFLASGNPEDTWGEDGLKDPDTGKPLRAPRQISRTCLVHAGTETDLTDDMVYECNLWDPLSPKELRARLKRHQAYYRHHPDHRPKEH